MLSLTSLVLCLSGVAVAANKNPVNLLLYATENGISIDLLHNVNVQQLLKVFDSSELENAIKQLGKEVVNEILGVITKNDLLEVLKSLGKHNVKLMLKPDPSATTENPLPKTQPVHEKESSIPEKKENGEQKKQEAAQPSQSKHKRSRRPRRSSNKRRRNSKKGSSKRKKR